ncbi:MULTISPECIES: hypothetical protein [Enorma]|uniref:hypothetical protein n=1 Tax=Enorma TaxID=1472762 RepID=UPI00034AE652|nr:MULTISPECIES: hypothetical protein [Enorma]
MTAIDVHEKSRLLGIDYDDYTEAVKLTGSMIFDAIDSGTYGVDAYIDMVKSLPPKPMVALIRYDGLYKQYSRVFDFDGPIPGVEAAYPYAGRDDE